MLICWFSHLLHIVCHSRVSSLRPGVLVNCADCCIPVPGKKCLPPEGVKCVSLIHTFPVRASDYLSQFTVILPCKIWGSVNSSLYLAVHMKYWLISFHVFLQTCHSYRCQAPISSSPLPFHFVLYTSSPSDSLFRCLHILVCRMKPRARSLAFRFLSNLISNPLFSFCFY